MAKVNLNAKIRVLKKAGFKRGASAERYALYKTGITVATYVKRVVEAGQPSHKALLDIRYDTGKEHIELY